MPRWYQIKVSNALRILLAAALLTHLTVSGAIEWRALLGVGDAWVLSSAALLLLFAVLVATSMRLCVLLVPLGLAMSLFASLRLTLVGAFFNAGLPGIGTGDVVRIGYALAGNPGRRTEIAAIMLLDRAVGVLVLLIWPLLAMLALPGGLVLSGEARALVITAAAMAAVMMLGFLIGVTDRVRYSWIFERYLPKIGLGRLAITILDTVRSYRLHAEALLTAVGLSLLVQAIQVAAMLLLVEATHAGGADWSMMVVIPLGFLVNALPLTPGGLGVGEVAFDRLFRLQGLTGGVEALLAWRLLTTALDVFGLVVYVRGRRIPIEGAPRCSN